MTLSDCRGLIFDLDGTLLDSMSVWDRVDEAFLRRRGIPIPEDYARSIAHLAFPAAAQYTIERFGLSESIAAITAEWHALALDAYRRDVRLKPGAREYLSRASGSPPPLRPTPRSSAPASTGWASGTGLKRS